MRKILPKFHIYIEANQHKQNTEKRYFDVLNRNVNQIIISSDLSLNELIIHAKRAEKNRFKTQYKNDQFVAVLDGDLDYNNLGNSIEARSAEISRIAKQPNIDIFISNRCWENWIVLHVDDFSSFTTNSMKLPIPNYTKTRQWYKDNEKYLLDSINVAIDNSKRLRKQQYSNNQIEKLELNALSNFSDQVEIKQILSINPITYIDLLIEKIYQLDSDMKR